MLQLFMKMPTEQVGKSTTSRITMNEKELREIKRRFRPDRSNISKIVGCFVNTNGQILSRFNQSVMLSESDEGEELLSVMKKTLSGSLGTNLIDIEFSTADVTNRDEHKLLMTLRDTRLSDTDALERFYQSVTESVHLSSNYVIMLACDVYDVSSGKDDEAGGSYTTFTYIVCSICPLKDADSGLFFRESDSLFHSVNANAILTRPLLGFMFPTFDDRMANIYHTLLYTKDISNTYPEFTERVFGKDAPMPPKVQKSTFDYCLTSALGEECSFDTVKSVHTQIGEMMEVHKLTNSDEPFVITKSIVKDVLEKCGVGEEKVVKTTDRIDENFGKNAELRPKNVINTKRLDIKMPDVEIKIKPEKYNLVSTQVIGGKKYVMIEAEDGVVINGIEVKIED